MYSKFTNRLNCVRDSLTAKGHPMQDAATIKMALIDIVDVIKELLESFSNCCDVSAPKKVVKPKKRIRRTK